MEPKNSNYYFSKSQVLKGLECPFSFWQGIHNPGARKQDSEQFQIHYNLQYREVFRLFKKFLLSEMILQNQNLSFNKPLFKLQFNFQQFSADIDALVKTGEEWELFLLKLASNIKKTHIKEAAFQLYILKNLNWKIKTIKLVTINPKFYYENEIIVKDYFVIYDITSKTVSSLDDLQKDLEKFLEYSNYTNSQIQNLPKCKSIKDCRNISFCYNINSPQILELRESGQLLSEFLDKQIFSFEQIPDTVELNRIQKIQVEATLNNREYINFQEIHFFLKKLKYPVYFLDFETINPVKPLYKYSRPFEHIPFLLYMFILDSPSSELKEQYFVEDFQSDPRRGILEILSKTITKEGTILCFNDLIEKGCLRAASQVYPEYIEWFESIQNNFLDISILFKNLHYYHPKQKGKASLKAVLEPMTGLNYEDLEIQDGGIANFEFLKLKISKRVMPDEKEQVVQKILNYCRRDAFALFKILEKLYNVVRNI